MRNFKIRPATLLSSFRLRRAAHSRLKNLSTTENATRRATRIWLRGVNQKIFFAQKLPDLAPVLNTLMQLKHVTDMT